MLSFVINWNLLSLCLKRQDHTWTCHTAVNTSVKEFKGWCSWNNFFLIPSRAKPWTYTSNKNSIILNTHLDQMSIGKPTQRKLHSADLASKACTYRWVGLLHHFCFFWSSGGYAGSSFVAVRINELRHVCHERVSIPPCNTCLKSLKYFSYHHIWYLFLNSLWGCTLVCHRTRSERCMAGIAAHTFRALGTLCILPCPPVLWASDMVSKGLC